VVAIAVKIDPDTLEIQVPVLLELEPDRVAPIKVIKKRAPNVVMKRLIERGMRAQLEMGSLLTGQLFVNLEFYPDLPRQSLIMTGKYPEIPAVPATMDQLRRTVTDVMAEIRRMPLDKIAEELLETIEGANRLVNAPELDEAVRNLNATLHNIEKMTHDVDQKVDRLTTSMEKTLATTREAFEVADQNSPAVVNLNSALKELAAAARSIRILADYLEQHPESLVHGKKSE